MDKAFLTGSRVYGYPRFKTPREDKPSDIDLVVLMSPKEMDTLVEFCVEMEYGIPQDVSWGRDPGDSQAGIRESASLRFAGLNLIVCTREEDFEMWRTGTAQLVAQQPVTRDVAVGLFAKLRKKMKAWRLFNEEAFIER